MTLHLWSSQAFNSPLLLSVCAHLTLWAGMAIKGVYYHELKLILFRVLHKQYFLWYIVSHSNFPRAEKELNWVHLNLFTLTMGIRQHVKILLHYNTLNVKTTKQIKFVDTFVESLIKWKEFYIGYIGVLPNLPEYVKTLVATLYVNIFCNDCCLFISCKRWCTF